MCPLSDIYMLKNAKTPMCLWPFCCFPGECFRCVNSANTRFFPEDIAWRPLMPQPSLLVEARGAFLVNIENMCQLWIVRQNHILASM